MFVGVKRWSFLTPTFHEQTDIIHDPKIRKGSDNETKHQHKTKNIDCVKWSARITMLHIAFSVQSFIGDFHQKWILMEGKKEFD